MRLEPNFAETSTIIDTAEQVRKPTSGTSYLVNPAYPGLFIKLARHERYQPEADIDMLRAEYRTYYDLAVGGLRVVPFSVVEHGGRLAIAAHRVDGAPLVDKLATNLDILERYDQVLALQIAKLATIRGADRTYPTDIYGPNQCMWGNLWGTYDEPGVIFVDVDTDEGLLSNIADLADDGNYYRDLTLQAACLADVKQDIGVELPQSRDEILRQLEGLSSIVRSSPRAQMFRASLLAYDVEELQDV